MIKKLSVNDIDNLGQNVLDNRTEKAFDSLEHPVMYCDPFPGDGGNFQLRRQLQLNRYMSQLSKNIKSINYYSALEMYWSKFSYDVKSMAQKFPKLETFPDSPNCWEAQVYLDYVNNTGLETSSLQSIKISGSRFWDDHYADQFRQIFTKCPSMTKLQIDFKVIHERAVEVFQTSCPNIKKLLISFVGVTVYEPLYRLIITLPSLDCLILIGPELNESFNEFLSVCTTQKPSLRIEVELSVRSSIDDLRHEFDSLITVAGLTIRDIRKQVSRRFHNLRRGIIMIFDVKSTLMSLCDKQSCPAHVELEIYNMAFGHPHELLELMKFITVELLKNFLQVRGQQLKVLTVTVKNQAKAFVALLVKSNLRIEECAIVFENDSEKDLTTDDVISLYGLPIRRHIRLKGGSSYLRLKLVEINMILKIEKKCRILV